MARAGSAAHTDVSGMSAADADQLRRAFIRKDGEALIAAYAVFPSCSAKMIYLP